MKKKPKIICICGSTRFADLHAIRRWEFEKTGEYICLMINYLPADYAKEKFGEGKHDHFGEALGLKDILDELHFRKIDLCDAVFVINYDGYIGESTRNEIEYATKLGKEIGYLEPLKSKDYMKGYENGRKMYRNCKGKFFNSRYIPKDVKDRDGYGEGWFAGWDDEQKEDIKVNP